MLNLPTGLGRAVIVIGAGVWLGALLGRFVPISFAVVLVGMVVGLTVLVGDVRWLLIAAVGVGAMSGSFAAARADTTWKAELPVGRGTVLGVALTDAVPHFQGVRLVMKPTGWGRGNQYPTPWSGPALAVTVGSSEAVAGDRLQVSGRIVAEPTSIRGDPVAGRLIATEVVVVSVADSALFRAGNAVRERVRKRLATLGSSSETGLLAGFLIGDTTQLTRSDTESLRRAGLTHYVAVSGSNVALVLGAWWLVLGPTGASNRVRAATGLVLLLVFVVATRWESSVIRAATMAALIMGGRAMGVALDAWTALGGAIVLLLTISGDLAFDVGFQLSVAATAGVLASIGMWRHRSPRFVWGLLAATVGAQAAVAPLLLLHFGTVPLLSPVANVVAAPLVTIATGAAGISVLLNWDVPLHLAEPLAGAVLGVARTAAGWPQLNTVTAIGTAAAVGVAWATPLRIPVLVAIAAVAILSVVPPRPPERPTLVFLDVGQGDAVLLRDPSGAVALIDGGRDPTLLRAGLRRHGIGRIDLVVATHGDSDHVGGLVDLPPRDIGALWIPDFAATGDLLDGIVASALASEVEVRSVSTGDSAVLGEFRLEVLGPVRRYAADNDGSVVLLVRVGEVAVLLPGDIGAAAQRDLPPVRPDVLMVPHHGAATTDLGWLRETVGPIAVISVGENSYGHPDPSIVDALTEADSQVLTTLDRGDITFGLR